MSSEEREMYFKKKEHEKEERARAREWRKNKKANFLWERFISVFFLFSLTQQGFVRRHHFFLSLFSFLFLFFIVIVIDKNAFVFCLLFELNDSSQRIFFLFYLQRRKKTERQIMIQVLLSN